MATAPERATSWLLVEHPGPWSAADLPRGLPPETVRVWEAASNAGVRCQWIRPIRNRRGSTASVFVAGARPDGAGGRWVEHRSVADFGELADLDVAAVAEGRPPGFGAVTEQRIVLVCTHGKRDVCCARFGRPVAERLDRRLPGQVWETTHVGGHRFAANVVALPEGTYHGGITVADTDGLAEALLAGRVVPARLRGRVGLPPAVQAADYYARIRCGIHRLDGIVALGHEEVGTGGTIRVALTGDGVRYDVYVRPRNVAGAGPTLCAPGSGPHTTFDLVAMKCRDRETYRHAS